MIGEWELLGIGLFSTEPLCRQECQIHGARKHKKSGWLHAGEIGEEGAAY